MTMRYTRDRDSKRTSSRRCERSNLSPSRFFAAALVACTWLVVGACSQAQSRLDSLGREPIVGLPCEGCEAVFAGMPVSLTSSARIASAGEAGEPMQIVGTVRDGDGRVASGVIVYAYHTNANGVYPTDDSQRGKAGFRHGRLRGWAKTDANGRYQFDTIRPAGYPSTDLPAHVHMHVLEPGRCTYYIDDILFEDDPRLTADMRRKLTLGRGGNGIAIPHQDADGVWLVTRDITLGERIPGYPKR